VLLFRRNAVDYIGVVCDECADARDAGSSENLVSLGWHLRSDDRPQDLCPQCNPVHPVGGRGDRRSSERAEEVPG
jgi:hypothetical protein